MKIYFKKLKPILFFISLLYLTLLIPLSITIYSISWYEYNLKNQEITTELNSNITTNATTNLISFFKFNENLNDLWNEKEKIHMNDVREIYLKIMIIGIITLILTIILFQKELILKYSKYNIWIILSLFILIPFFTYLFNTIFHQLLFDNSYWIINSNDISYYLFPIEFFRNSLLFIFIISILENLGIYYYFKYKNKE